MDYWYAPASNIYCIYILRAMILVLRAAVDIRYIQLFTKVKWRQHTADDEIIKDRHAIKVKKSRLKALYNNRNKTGYVNADEVARANRWNSATIKIYC